MANPVQQALERRFPRGTGAQHWFDDGRGRAELRTCGLADHVRRAPVSAATTFNAFSCTKPVTAVAVLRLVADGSLELDEPVRQLLPDLPYDNGATVRQVLSHQAGLPNPMPLAWVHRDEAHAAYDGEAFADGVFAKHVRAGSAGRRAVYSNVGFLILGRLVARRSGLSYQDFVRQHVLAPTGVPLAGAGSDGYLDFALPHDRHAVGTTQPWSPLGLLVTFLPDRERVRERAAGLIRYRPFHLNGAAYGGLLGNALGFAPWLTALARRDEALLPAAQYDQLFAPQPLATGAPSGHTLAWFTGRVGAHRYVTHPGGGPGFGAEIRVYPDLGAASAVLSNTTIVHDARLLDALDRTWLP